MLRPGFLVYREWKPQKDDIRNRTLFKTTLVCHLKHKLQVFDIAKPDSNGVNGNKFIIQIWINHFKNMIVWWTEKGKFETFE